MRHLAKQLVADKQWKLGESQYTVIVNKFRQSGISTSVLAFFLWRAALSKRHNTTAIFPSREDASGMARRLREMVRTIDEDYSLRLGSNNLSFIELLGRGSITLKSTSARSQSLDGLFLDEAAFHSRASEVFSSSAPALAHYKNSAIKYIVSTPKGKNNFFYNFLAETVEDIGSPSDIGWRVANGELYSENYPGFFWYRKGHTFAVFLGHQALPQYQDYSLPEFIEYAREKYRISEDKALVEFGLTFESSDDEVFKAEIVDRCVGEGFAENKPDEDGIYYSSLDTNNGTGNDFAVLLIFRIIEGKKRIVRQWRSNTHSTNQSLFYCRQLLSEFNPRAIYVETNGGGKAWANSLSESNFNIVESYTTQANKASMISELLLSLEQQEIQLDKKANAGVIRELLSFQRLGTTSNGGIRYGAAEGSHDDCVMSLAQGNFYITQELRSDSYLPEEPEELDFGLSLYE